MGNMFSGKTSELIRRLKRLKVLGKQIVVVNSGKDTRSPDEVLKTHDNVKFDCHKVFKLYELLGKCDFEDADVVAIDVVVVVFAVAIAVFGCVVGHRVRMCAPVVCVVAVVSLLLLVGSSVVDRSKGLPRTRFNNLRLSASSATHRFHEFVAGFHDFGAVGASCVVSPPSIANAFFAFRQSREK